MHFRIFSDWTSIFLHPAAAVVVVAAVVVAAVVVAAVAKKQDKKFQDQISIHRKNNDQAIPFWIPK